MVKAPDGREFVPVQRPPAQNRVNRHCDCGAMVWDVPYRAKIRFGVTFTCWNCGRDHSRRTFPGYHLWAARNWRRLTLKRFRIWRRGVRQRAQLWLSERM